MATTMRTWQRWAVLCCAALLALCANAADELFPPPDFKPFDPKPLMEQLAARTNADKFRFVVVGDNRNSPAFSEVLKFIDDTVKPDFVLFTGDLVQSGGGRSGASYWNRITEQAGEHFRKRPWWPVIGNHELGGSSAPAKRHDDEDDNQVADSESMVRFKEFFNLEREYYSFSFRNTRFIALPWPQPKDKSKKWLEKELKDAAKTAQHIFVFGHMPYYTVGTKSKSDVPNKETSITKLFRKHHVRTVFSGHDHIYYRTTREGVPYIISAGGGARIYATTRQKEALPDDVYYGQDPESLISKNTVVEAIAGMIVTPKNRYVLHNGVTGKDQIADAATQYVVVVAVDGKNVTLECVSVKGEKWDEATLRGEE